MHDIYGNEIRASGVPTFTITLDTGKNVDIMLEFASTFDVGAGYVVRDVVTNCNGTHELRELMHSHGSENNGTVALLDQLALEVGPLPCNPLDTYANLMGNTCLRSYCGRGSEVSSDNVPTILIWYIFR